MMMMMMMMMMASASAAAFSVAEYFARLRLKPSELDMAPTLTKLQKIQEAHLANIPFENTSQHGVLLDDDDGPVRLDDVAQIAYKILKQNRGGFCFELNGLLAAFLEQLGYRVTRVPACVYAGGSYRPEPTHMILIVQTSSNDKKYFVDVGFGEPPLHPLRYDLLSGEHQITPEGMQSRLIQKEMVVSGKNLNGVNIQDDVVELYWRQPGVNNWVPRLEWNYHASMLDSKQGPELIDFSDALKLVQAEESIFSQKLIVCLLTREQKVVLAGDRLRITGPPRFQENANNKNEMLDPPRTITNIDTEDQARNILQDIFGQPLSSTKGLNLSKSKSSDIAVWSQM